MAGRTYHVLFLCTGNSARSILGEALVDHWGQGRFKGHSAGSFPKPAPHPYALDLLSERGLSTQGLHSKSWNVFARPGSPPMDFVLTVCDQAANEPCPVWPGQPVTAHWGLTDPAAIEGSEIARRAAFRRTFRELENRIKTLVSLPIEALDRIALGNRLAEIGRPGAAEPVEHGA